MRIKFTEIQRKGSRTLEIQRLIEDEQKIGQIGPPDKKREFNSDRYMARARVEQSRARSSPFPILSLDADRAVYLSALA